VTFTEGALTPSAPSRTRSATPVGRRPAAAPKIASILGVVVLASLLLVVGPLTASTSPLESAARNPSGVEPGVPVPVPMASVLRGGDSVSRDPGPGSAYSGTEPAPMGLADLGSGSGAQAASYATTEFVGTVAFGSLATENITLPEPAAMSFQLNAFLTFSVGSGRYAYWVQDVALFDTSSRAIGWEDNVWNVTSDGLPTGSLAGNGSVTGTGAGTYYGVAADCALVGACVTLAEPARLVLEFRASVGSGGIPTVRVGYDDLGTYETFDTITFPFASGASQFSGFRVDPGLEFAGGCPRCYGDVELVAGGPGDGFQTSLTGASGLTFDLQWWNGHNLEAVPNAVDHGEATAEGISNVAIGEGSDAAGAPIAVGSVGGGTLGSLWSESTVATIEVSVLPGSTTGTVSTGGSPVAFQGGFLEEVVVPGTVSLTATVGARSYPLGSPVLTAGEALTLEVGGEPLVFVPSGLPPGTLWSVAVGSGSLNGTGNITFGEPNGTFDFTVRSLTGYRASPTSGNGSISGAAVDVAIAWSAVPSPWFTLLHDLGAVAPLLALLCVLIAVAAVVATHTRTRRGRR